MMNVEIVVDATCPDIMRVSPVSAPYRPYIDLATE
jgi:hypothetical protein